MLDGLVAFASIGDELAVAPQHELNLAVDGPFASALAGDSRGNLVWRAAELLAARLGRRADVAIALTKNLPVASGIGGGSSDAAACLKALAALWHCGDAEILSSIAAELGSDVPACLDAQPAWIGSVGDRVDRAGRLPRCGVVLANPGVALPTASVYRAFKGRFSPPARFPIPSDAPTFATLLAERNNDLTGAAMTLAPEIGAVLQALAETEGALLVRMSGSGATCFALFAALGDAERAARRLRERHPAWWVAAGLLSSEPGSTASPS